MKLKFTGTEKQCIQCKNTLPLEKFYLEKKRKIYSSRCKKCDVQLHTKRFNESYQRRAEILCNTAKYNSKKQQREFSITKKDIIHQYEIQNGKCYYSGRNLSYTNGDEYIMSIDRKNSNIGYVKDNIVLCCWRVNKMKNNYSINDFVNLCKDIYEFSSQS